MPVYEFTFEPKSTKPESLNFETHTPAMDRKPERLPDPGPKTTIVTGSQNVAPEDVIQVVTRGFHQLDEGMKNWLSGIKVPTLDSYKVASAHVAASDRTILAWAQEFFDGRVPLPVISVHRASWAFDPTRFSPPYAPIAKKFIDKSGRYMRNIFRPVPFKVEYAISIWGEFKQDVEAIQTNIIKRMNPTATFTVDDDHVRQFVRIVDNGITNSSDIELTAKERPKVIYDISLSVDYAIAINERIVPTVLGRIASIKESVTDEVFDVYKVDDLV